MSEFEYKLDYLQYLLQNERSFAEKYPITFPRENTHNRTIVVGWLMEVMAEYFLNQETLHLAIFLVDRYWTLRGNDMILPHEIQLIGITGLFLASKFEEVYSPLAVDMSYITDHSCTTEQIFNMEPKILEASGYQFGRPTVVNFISYWSEIYQFSKEVMLWARYYAQLSLMSVQSSEIPASEWAKTCIFLASEEFKTYSPFQAHKLCLELFQSLKSKAKEIKCFKQAFDPILRKLPVYVAPDPIEVEPLETSATLSSFDSGGDDTNIEPNKLAVY